MSWEEWKIVFELSENFDRLHSETSKWNEYMMHTLSLKVSSPEILIVRSYEIRSRCSKLGWCLTYVEEIFSDEEIPW